ncbi:MAG: NAD(P)H-dependent glycerol-3-phosphate dehydrogenase [Bacteroidales bacterium]|nr:NAD(P)H-dependent glycerol-3-phosphate dehydrogenase [Bacteroidales bacterium]
MNSIGIIGEGSWATALLKVLQQNGHYVHWLIRFEDIRNEVIQNHHNPAYLSHVELNPQLLRIYSELDDFLSQTEVVFLVLPSAFTEYLLFDLPLKYTVKKYFISATKGILPESHLTVTQYLNQKLQVPPSNLAFISGPSHAEEIAMERLTYLTIFSDNNNLTSYIKNLITNRYIQVFESNDVLGAEYATALKNIMAIASGIIHSLGFGDNFQAVFTSFAIKEIEKFLSEISPEKRNITDFVYLGDLLVTCYSQFSRNRTFGIMIGKGYSVKAAQFEMNMIAEGYYAVKSIIHIAEQHNIELPICQTVYNILYQRYAPSIEIKLLIDKLNKLWKQ